MTFSEPRWLQDLRRFLPLKSQFVLTGNIRDLQATEISPGLVTSQRFDQTLANALFSHGYGQVVLFNQVRGFQPMACTIPSINVTPAGGLQLPSGNNAPQGPEALAPVVAQLVRHEQAPVALIIDFASRLTIRPEGLSPAEHQLFTQALVLSHEARARPIEGQSKSFYNTIVWVVEREGDLPDWMVVGNPRLRVINVPKPDQVVRRALAPSFLRAIAGFKDASDDQRAAAVDDFVDGTDGLLLLDLNAISVLGRVEGINAAHIADAVRRYKVGVTEDPWQRLDRSKIRNADDLVRRRVKGQDLAVTHMLDLVKRAVTGVGGKRGNRPRGVAFLAGPTGVGKTELAKTITSLLFGDESAYIRFDMSEFSAEHSDQRLIGAPPGYVGYDMGGELTNAVREKPFSVVLFDEIEKAHPRILDKFLQILDDGVLTSGRGDRVYFSETLIIFTSNLGIYRSDESGRRIANVVPEDSYDTMHDKVLSEIRDHFKLVLNRPEILNRIGENIIVFDFIRPDVAAQIYDQMLSSILDDLQGKGYTIILDEPARAHLREQCLRDLSNGGRGIRNQLEVALVNPLARQLFDQDAQSGQSFALMFQQESGRLALASA
ncbi:energy-coupling factor transporter ATP-binding protein EcfA2 [Acidovorax soli]|uniref:Energy-coupling factor transporter ATP-binding protein EcfA2 n=1 Tax=Acidovorax soli TaxID=592050 RepID=A0A7X0PBM9_9BURK|nr:AAA family ATPase [Acidovorax soli]MBB6558866.1 energy-coupling factor transporter ATP-binding protein EcfA2 [Acidovorax soli]